MNDGLVISLDFDTTKAQVKQRKLNRDMEVSELKAKNIAKNIEKLNAELEKEKSLQADIKGAINAQLEESKQLEKHIENLKQGTASVADTMQFGGLETANQKYNEIESNIKKAEQTLAKSYNKQQAITKEISKQEFSLNQQNAKTKNIGDQILLNTKKQNKFTKAFDKSQKSADRFGRRLKSLIASALFFSVVTKAFTALRNEFGKLITEAGTKTAQLVAQLNGSLAVLGTTLYEGARPYIEWILDKLIKMVNILTNGLAKILGKNVNEMKKLAQNTKKAGEEAKKATAGFDTIQTLNYSNGDSNKGSSADFGALNDGIDEETAVLMTILSGALLVLGVILTFTGANIPLGLGLIVAGAAGLVTTLSASWNELPQKTKDTITVIMAIVSGALLVLGVILAFTGVAIPLGIALMALGAIGLVAAAKLGWNELPQKTKNTIAIITAIVSGALLVLGVILAFTGAAIPLGIALIALGAAGLVASYKVAWNTLPQKTKDTVSTIMAIGGALFLLLGLILILTGVGIPLGIGCILLGVSAIGGAVALSPGDTFVKKIKNLWENVKNITRSFISWFSKNVLDGIFGEGIGDTFMNIFNSWAYMWEDIIDFFGAIIKGDWKRAGKSLANVFIDIFNILIQKLTLPFRLIVGGVSKLTRAIGKLLGKNWGFDTSWTKTPLIPRLATGAVIPGGKPFYAMLGDQPRGKTNIEAPEDLIRQIVREESGSQNFEIKATGSMAQLIRLLRLEIKKEDDRATIF